MTFQSLQNKPEYVIEGYKHFDIYHQEKPCMVLQMYIALFMPNILHYMIYVTLTQYTAICHYRPLHCTKSIYISRGKSGVGTISL